MEKLTRYADVFLGCGPVDLPEPKGVAAAWHFIKGLAGNCTPAAAIPFGKMTACSYSGGYSSGYGNIGVNCGEPLREIMEANLVRGFSHIHPSGSGFTGTFYNYALTAPYYGEHPETAFEPDHMQEEEGRPGYYAVTMKERGIRAEMTVSRQAAHHRYTFKKAGGRIAVDFTNDGLMEEMTRAEAQGMTCRIVRADTVECEVTLHGLKMYFCVRCPGAQARLWEKGCVFEGLPAGQVRLAMGASPRSMKKAAEGMEETGIPFEEIAAQADGEWNRRFAAIEIEAENERDRRLFYSNFYHTLIKPCDCRGESFLYDDEEAFTADLCTMWDQYKTQLPLLYSLYPDISDQLMRTILAYCRAVGRMPHILLLDRRPSDSEDKQAQMLAEHTLLDAYVRGVPLDLEETARQIRREVLNPNRFADYKASGVCGDIAHTIDVADGCKASELLAEAAGDGELAEVCRELAGKWTAAFDRESGLLDPSSRFYEGSHWNYSFRLVHDMDERLRIAGGREKYARLLDRFFGFTHADDVSGRFEGFNNETDMETPYAYYYADRHDRICEVISAGMEYMFTEGRGGIPGNNDSGGLSSLYMWNAMGIFPVSGQNLMLIGTPRLRKARMHLANGKTFEIEKEGEGIYVREAVLSGRKLDRFSFAASEMMKGGTLRLVMSRESVR